MSESPDSDRTDDFIDNLKRQDAARDALRKADTPAPRPRTATNGSIPKGYAQQALSSETEALRTAAVGTRQTTLNTAAFNLGQLVQPGGLDFDVIVTELRSAALASGLTERELKSWDLPERGIRDGMKKLRDPSKLKGKPYTRSTFVPRLIEAVPAEVVLSFTDIEDGFWTARKSLENIYLSALSKMCAPWSVLACCAARALATVRPNVVLPDLIGGPGSLNWFGAITATSGGGKGAASATARMLVKDFVIQRNTGSGEGMIGAFIRPRIEDEPAGLHESIMFIVDEIDSLTAQSKRSGATTMSVLRSAFSGETLGFSYVNKNTPTLEAHSYRMTMVISVQPQRAADLLADYQGGTPQRFMWFPGTDERISTDLAGGFVEPLTLPKPGSWQYPTTIQIPTAARDLILRERVKTQQGRVGALDGHALFVREKFAFALAVLDGRTYVSEEDWELSGIAAKVSDRTRDWVTALAEEAKVTDAMERGMLQGVSSLAADDEKTRRNSEKRYRLIARVCKYLRAADDGMTRRDVQRRLTDVAPEWVDWVLTQLVDDGIASTDGKRWYTA